MTDAFSKTVVFETRHYEAAHGRKPRFTQDCCGWAFVVSDHGPDLIWTRGRKRAELKQEIAAAVKAPKGTIIYARVMS